MTYSSHITLQELPEVDLCDRFLESGQWGEINFGRQWIPYIYNSFLDCNNSYGPCDRVYYLTIINILE